MEMATTEFQLAKEECLDGGQTTAIPENAILKNNGLTGRREGWGPYLQGFPSPGSNQWIIVTRRVIHSKYNRIPGFPQGLDIPVTVNCIMACKHHNGSCLNDHSDIGKDLYVLGNEYCIKIPCLQECPMELYNYCSDSLLSGMTG